MFCAYVILYQVTVPRMQSNLLLLANPLCILLPPRYVSAYKCRSSSYDYHVSCFCDDVQLILASFVVDLTGNVNLDHLDMPRPPAPTQLGIYS